MQLGLYKPPPLWISNYDVISWLQYKLIHYSVILINPHNTMHYPSTIALYSICSIAILAMFYPSLRHFGWTYYCRLIWIPAAHTLLKFHFLTSPSFRHFKLLILAGPITPITVHRPELFGVVQVPTVQQTAGVGRPALRQRLPRPLPPQWENRGGLEFFSTLPV